MQNKDTAQTRTLKRALHIAGGEEKLARNLKCDAAQLRRWLAGDEETPSGVYLKALDVVSHGPG